MIAIWLMSLLWPIGRSQSQLKSGQALLLLEEAKQFRMQLDVIFCSAVISACEKCEASKCGGEHVTGKDKGVNMN